MLLNCHNHPKIKKTVRWSSSVESTEKFLQEPGNNEYIITIRQLSMRRGALHRHWRGAALLSLPLQALPQGLGYGSRQQPFPEWHAGLAKW